MINENTEAILFLCYMTVTMNCSKLSSGDSSWLDHSEDEIAGLITESRMTGHQEIHVHMFCYNLTFNIGYFHAIDDYARCMQTKHFVI